MMKLLPFEGRMSLCEAAHGPTRYTLVSPEGRKLHTGIQCKDYLQDAFWSEHMRKDVSIYGFTWKPGTLDVTAEKFFLAVDGPKETLKKFENSRAFMNAWETRLGWPMTDTKWYEDTILFMLDKEWFASPIRISAAALFIRIGTEWDGGDVIKYVTDVTRKPIPYPADASVAQGALDRIKKIWEDKKFPEQKWEEFTNTYSEGKRNIHGASGLRDYKRFDR